MAILFDKLASTYKVLWANHTVVNAAPTFFSYTTGESNNPSKGKNYSTLKRDIILWSLLLQPRLTTAYQVSLKSMQYLSCLGTMPSHVKSQQLGGTMTYYFWTSETEIIKPQGGLGHQVAA